MHVHLPSDEIAAVYQLVVSKKGSIIYLIQIGHLCDIMFIDGLNSNTFRMLASVSNCIISCSDANFLTGQLNWSTRMALLKLVMHLVGLGSKISTETSSWTHLLLDEKCLCLTWI